MALWNSQEKPKTDLVKPNSYTAYSPYKASKMSLGMDLARKQSGNLGLTQAEQNQLSEAATQQAGAGLEAQNQEIAQQSLASGGGAGPSARYAALQRSMGRSLTNAQSQAQTEAARISQAKTLSENQDINARIAQQKAEQTQKNQFWAGMVLNIANPLAKGASSAISQGTG